MATKKKTKLSYESITNYGYGIVKYDCHRSYNENGRCTIYNGSITEIDQLSLYKSITGKTTIDNIKDYCLDRFIRKLFVGDIVSFEVESGYYGDEPSYSIANSFTESLNDLINRLNNKETNESELIEEILILEYGYILPELKNRIWSFVKKPLELINPAAGMKHIQIDIVNRYKKEFAEEKYNLTCLCEYNFEKYRLIDGCHRYSAANQLKLKEINIIYCH